MNNLPTITDEEKQAMEQELDKPQSHIDSQPDEQIPDEESSIVFDMADKDEFDFGSSKDENDHDNDFGLNIKTTDEPEPRKRTNRKFLACTLSIPIIMLVAFIYLVF
ncbi:hypothetical protein [Pseudomonas fluorescens]|uniref:hypothetical protein n=1 Tax=Pseudomonas fluorescens TaxID=294 RepID=UPI00058A75DF|nr:hypothetical protein [Pseudomonas fluorescens]CEL31203.1 hypothetical protein SRM1_04567 [Pseudomonas fluorescens]